MPNPPWFNEEHFADQKAQQMNALAWKDAAGKLKTDWKAEDWPDALAAFNRQNGTSYSAYDNFVACNRAGYEDSIVLSAVNVSPNPLFNIPVYLTNLANHYNQAGFSADGYPSGQWTAVNALCHLFENEHTSAWEHFTTYGLEHQLNPSNSFDVSAYLTARAEKMGPGHTVQDAIAELLTAGVNPIEDYYITGRHEGIRIQTTREWVEPGIDQAHVWGGPVTLPDDKPVDDDKPGGSTQPGNNGGDSSQSGGDNSGGDDPEPPAEPEIPVVREDVYDKVDDTKEIVAGSEPITSEDGKNTWFTGSTAADAENNITPDTVINAGADAANSLIMDLSGSWSGFKGVEVDGKTQPSVTNVGRVVLNNDAAAGADLSFAAKNIAGVEQFDINNNDNGAVSLQALPDTVKTINLKGIAANDQGNAPTTSIAFEKAPPALNIGVENVCASQGAAPIKTDGVKELTITSYGTGNAVNLKDAAGVEKLVVADGAVLTIADSDGASIKEYDASAATRNVDIGVSSLQDDAVVKGGSGTNDKLTFVDEAKVNDAQWSGIEELVFKNGGDIDAAKATGISKIVQDGNRNLNLSNLSAEHLEVVATENAEQSPMARTCAILRAKGKIGDVSWSTHGSAGFGSEITADFVCDATGDAYITMQGKDRLGVSSVFEFRQMTGTLTIDDPNPTDPNAYANSSITGVKLQAENATGLDITHTGSMKICGALWKVENVDVKMTDYVDAGVNGLLKLPELPSARNVDISADRMDIYISGLGSQNTAKGMDLAIHDAADVHIDHIMSAAGASPINAVIDSYGDVEIGKIEAGGDVELTVSGVNIVAEKNIYGVNDGFKGASLNLDFSQVHGDVGSSEMYIDLQALGGSLTYAGAQGSDALVIHGLTGGAISSLDTGAGNDEVVIQTLKTIGSGQTATLDVDLGAGYNILRVYSMNQEGHLIVNASSSGGIIHTIAYECPPNMEISSVEKANAALRQIDAGFQLDTDVFVNDGVFEYGGNAYWIGNRIVAGVDNVTLVVAENTGAGVFVPDELAGV